MKLSKSQYIRGLQCTKSLWLKKYKEQVLTTPDDSKQTIFKTGDEVGSLACQLFPNGIKVKFNNNNFNEMIKTTKNLIDNGTRNIYEASFNFNGIFITSDILHINNDNSIEIYEVKSSTEVKDIYIDDASIQYYVLKELKFNIKKISIIHINNKYVRDNELEIDKLFTIVDITDKILKLQSDIPIRLKTFKKILDDRENEPEINIGTHCSKPYDCDAKKYCWRHIPDYSIFDISRLKLDKKFELYNQGIVYFKDLEDISNFSSAQKIQIQSELRNETIINKKAIKKFLDSLTYPIYHLDFETFQQAIPQWKGISPFTQIPFQYSIHIENKNSNGKNLIHKEFLGRDGIDPRYELAKQLTNDIPSDVTVLAYNMGFEKSIIKKLAEQFNEFSQYLMCIHNNIQDLMTPFQKNDYYTPSMKGSYSIKNVLPALVPEFKKAYKNLDLIHNGEEAMQAFQNLSKMDNEQKHKYRKALLEYCKLDTLAMVQILKKLKEIK